MIAEEGQGRLVEVPASGAREMIIDRLGQVDHMSCWEVVHRCSECPSGTREDEALPGYPLDLLREGESGRSGLGVVEGLVRRELE